MKGKTLGILTATAILLAGGAAIMVRSNDSSTSTGSSPRDKGKKSLLLPDAREQMGRIVKVRLARGAVETTLAQRELDNRPVWVVASKSDYPADSERVRKMIAELLESQIVETKTSKPELYERIGVNDPDKPGAAGMLIELMDAEGKTLGAAIVGNVSSTPSGEDPSLSAPKYFVRRKGEAQSYLAQGNLSFTAETMSWVNRTPLEVDATKVKSATITHTPSSRAQPSDTIVVGKERPEDPSFKLMNKPEGRETKDDYAATRVAQSIAGINIDDVAPASSVDFNNPELIAQYHTFDGTAITAKSTTHDGKTWWAFSASYEAPPAPSEPASDAPQDDAANAAARSRAEELNRKLAPWVFILPQYKLTSLTSRLEDLLKPAIAPAPAIHPETSPLQPPSEPAPE